MAWVLSPGDVAVWQDAPVDELLDVSTAAVTETPALEYNGSVYSTCSATALQQRLVSTALCWC
jgi:hypothetical protein